MDYEKIAQIAQEACKKAITAAQCCGNPTAEVQAMVFTSGIVDAIREYDRQKEEE